MTTPAAVESLESRRHLSVTLDDGLLTVTGTRRSDKFMIYVTDRAAPDGLLVIVNDHQHLRFDPAKVKRVKVDLGLGNDDVNFHSSSHHGSLALSLDVPVTVRGGAGNDTLGGPGGDTLNGGTGRDHLYGNRGDDHFVGVSDSDRNRHDRQPHEPVFTPKPVDPIIVFTTGSLRLDDVLA